MCVLPTVCNLTRVAWKSITKESGAQFVMLGGVNQILQWPAGNWDLMRASQQEVTRCLFRFEHGFVIHSTNFLRSFRRQESTT